MKRISALLVLLAVAASAALTLGTASVTAAPAAAAAPAHLCHLGEAYPNGRIVKTHCTANPIFAKTICTTFLPAMHALAPSTTFGPASFPSWTGTEVDCFYKASGRAQAFNINIRGGKTVSGALQFTFDDYTQSAANFACPWPSQAAKDAAGPNDNPQAHAPVWTTISGYKGFTLDECTNPDSSMAGEQDNGTWTHMVAVVAGHAFIAVSARSPLVDVTTADQMLPLVKQLIKTYRNS